MSMQKEKLFNEANKKNSKLDAKPILSQQKDTTTIPLTLFCYFLVNLGKFFPAWPNEMNFFTNSFVFILLTEFNMVYIPKIKHSPF